jgi:hypothetical protein
VVRLNARQSAIGALRAMGVTRFLWETTDRRWGDQEIWQPNSPSMPVFANRPLIQFVEGEMILGLRHHAVLRRLILAGPSGRVDIALPGGVHLGANTREGRDVVYLSVIDSVIEIRVESLSPGEEILDVFGFVLTE